MELTLADIQTMIKKSRENRLTCSEERVIYMTWSTAFEFYNELSRLENTIKELENKNKDLEKENDFLKTEYNILIEKTIKLERNKR